MKTAILALSLVAALAACNRGADNAAGAAGNTSNGFAGLTPPPERPADPAAQRAAMPAGLGCVWNRLSPEQRRGAAQAATGRVAREDPRAQAVLQALDACAAQLSWSPEKRRAAGVFSLAAAGVTGIREALGRANVRIEALDRTIITDRELMAAAESRQLTSAVGRAFATRHLPEIQRIAGSQSLRGEVGTAIGNYVRLRAVVEVSARQFGREP